MDVRKWFEVVEESLANESGVPADGEPLKKIVIAVVVGNPYAGVFSHDLSMLTQPSEQLGSEFGRRLLAANRGSRVESYGKACIVGVNGEYEHGNACLTSAFADPIRAALGGAKAWIPSTGKRGGPGTGIDVPLAHKDALYVRSHYDTITVHVRGRARTGRDPHHLRYRQPRPSARALGRPRSRPNRRGRRIFVN